MKNYNILYFILIICTTAASQDPFSILNKARETCITVKQGSFESNYDMKFMTENDTIKSNMKCTFRRLENDSIYSSAFHYMYPNPRTSSFIAMYSGEELVTYSLKDSTGRVISKTLWADEIMNISHNWESYYPFTEKNGKPLPSDKEMKEGTVRFIGEETVRSNNCYCIRYILPPESSNNDPMKQIRREYNFWINKSDYIPVQYTDLAVFVMNGDTMTQYRKYEISNYNLNKPIDEKLLDLSSVPKYIKLKDYEPYVRPEPLPNDTIAPAWDLATLRGDSLSLADLKGKLVLIDFFYKSCYPCMLALPALQSLHTKYKEKGLEVVGIDPYDDKEDNMPAFLSKRGVTYRVMLDGKNVAKSYKVSGYPTMYLIDRDGRIIHSQVGYGEGIEKSLEEIIIKYLQAE